MGGLVEVGGEPGVTSHPSAGNTIRAPPPRWGGDDLTRTIGFSLIAGLAVCLAVGVGLCCWRALTKRRAERYEWSSGPGVASAILPGIQRLRGNQFSSEPLPARQTPAHNWILATARRLVAQFAFFRKRENPNPAPPRETPEHNA